MENHLPKRLHTPTEIRVSQTHLIWFAYFHLKFTYIKSWQRTTRIYFLRQPYYHQGFFQPGQRVGEPPRKWLKMSFNRKIIQSVLSYMSPLSLCQPCLPYLPLEPIPVTNIMTKSVSLVAASFILYERSSDDWTRGTSLTSNNLQAVPQIKAYLW